MKSDIDLIIEWLESMIESSRNEQQNIKSPTDFNFYEGKINAYNDILNLIKLMKAVKGEM